MTDAEVKVDADEEILDNVSDSEKENTSSTTVESVVTPQEIMAE